MKQPNILVICSDQHHPRVAGYRGHPRVLTPNLDRLASEGTHFTRAYCNYPLCTPSRMSFITGRYCHELGVWNNGWPLSPDETTWARRLDRAGIPSVMCGKMDFVGEYQDGGFTEHHIIRRRRSHLPITKPFRGRLPGFECWWSKDDDTINHAGSRTEKVISDGVDGEEDDGIGNFDHDRIVTDGALKWLREHAGDASPWCLYLGLVFPHSPFTVPHRFFDLYYPNRDPLPVDARFPNPNLHPVVMNFQRSQRVANITDDSLRRMLAAYFGMVTCMDEMIGEVLAELESQGALDNTFVIFTSDHGEALGEHGLISKSTSYEGSVGVPLILRGPGIQRSQSIETPVSLLDLYPTILDMAGLRAEPDRRGCSLLPLARGAPASRPDFVLAEYHGWFLTQSWFMLVRGDLKYTWYSRGRPSLFNLRDDPDECHDLALDPASRPLLEQFEKFLRSVVDPDRIAIESKQALKLIGPDGEDYTETLPVERYDELEARHPEWRNSRF